MASNHKVEIIVGVKDLASKALGNVGKAASQIGKGFTAAQSNLNAFSRNLDATVSKLDKMANSMYKFNMHTADLQRNIRNIGVVGGAAAGAVAYTGMKDTLAFDYKSRTMQSRMGVGNDARKQIEDYVLNDLNLKVAFDPTQIMDMGVQLGQGGVSNTADMKSMMKTTSYFAEAVDAVPEQAAEMIIAAAKGFNISMENSSSITDKLSVALNNSLLGVDEMPHAIGELAGRANMYGQSFDSSLVALMTMRDQGMHAAQGSQDLLHGLRQASRAGNDEVLFKRTKGYFDSLGIDDGIFDKSTRKLKEYPELIADIEKAMIKSGNTNPKYNIKNEEDYQKFLAKNGGKAPDDFYDSMKAMPLISKIFGAAGMAPVLMGLQSKYEEVDKETGEKTGEVFYGAEALKKMYGNVKNSDGAVDDTHAIIAESGTYNLEVLKGAWQATQIKMLDGLVPILSTGAQGLTSFLSGGKSGNTGLKDFEVAIKEAAQNFRDEGNTGMGNAVQKGGDMLVGGAKIAQTMPPLFQQFADAFSENFVKGDWASGIISFPMSIIENSLGFIKDILSANKEFNALVNDLPDNLQDPAKLIETVTKGASVLVLSGAIVKIVELGLRTASAAIKGIKFAVNIKDIITKGLTGGKTGGGLGNILGKNMNINANVVNVNGKVVNGGGDGPDIGGGGKGGKTPGGKPSIGGTLKSFGKNPIGLGILGAGALAAGSAWGWSKWKGDMGGTNAKAIRGEVQQGDGGKAVAALAKENKITSKNVSGLASYIKKLEGGKGKSEDWKAPVAEITSSVRNLEPVLNNGLNGITTVTNQGVGNISNVTSTGISTMGGTLSSGVSTIAAATGSGTTAVASAAASGASQLAASASGVNGSIISGFGVANSRLQNIRLQNHTNVNVAAPNVSISGNIKQFLTVRSAGPKAYNSSNAKTPMDAQIARRMGL